MRKTILNEIKISGIGLHKGKESKLILKPQKENLGIRFFPEGKDLPIQANYKNLHSTLRGTNLSYNGKEIYTVEHILSAIFAFEIDDMDIEIYGEEPPALDGSSLIYAQEIKKAQIFLKEGNFEKKIFDKKIEFVNEESSYILESGKGFFIEGYFENTHPLIGKQNFLFEVNSDNYLKEIAPARTFGFEKEIEYLRKNSLALGGNLNNAIVLTENSILNKDPLRFKDEFVRHKILDLLGDLSLANIHFENVIIKAKKSSHKSNMALIKFLMEGK